MADWTETGDGTEYPEGDFAYEHSGDFEATHKKLTGEDRFDALCIFLRTKGIHVPEEIAPEESKRFETKHYADGSSATGVAPLPDQSPEEQKASE